MHEWGKLAMKLSEKDLLERIPKGDARAVARLITLAESRDPIAIRVQSKLYKSSGRAQVVGVTGSPGAGKSTLVDQIAKLWHSQGKKVAILAIDPSSPFTGGAVLGDRIRMTKSSEVPDLYIRSLASRGALGGLSRATLSAVQILDAAGFDLIIIETVGVGQGEVDIVRVADTCLVVLVPGMGDSVQAIKAGILEIADLFVINKADREGADALHRDLRTLLSLTERSEGAWEPQIIKSVATTGEGAEEIVSQTEHHLAWLKSSGEGKTRRLRILRDRIVKITLEELEQKIVVGQSKKLDQLVEDCFQRKIDPFSAAKELLS